MLFPAIDAVFHLIIRLVFFFAPASALTLTASLVSLFRIRSPPDAERKKRKQSEWLPQHNVITCRASCMEAKIRWNKHQNQERM